MATQIQLRRDTAANWTSTNPTLTQGEPGYETDTGKIKYGDGSTAWNSLAYASGGLPTAFAAGSAAAPGLAIDGDSNTGIYSPGADTLAFVEGGVEAARIDSSGRLLVGTSSANANGGILQLTSGITFPATAVAASDANTLDDYEEGTWTPVYAGSGGSIGATAYTQQAGTYTKIGRQVTAHMRVALSSKGSWTSTVFFTGLPFTAANNSQQNMGSIWTELVTFADQINARVGPNEATIVPRILTSTTGGDYLQTSGVTNTSTFYATVTYFI